MISWRSILRGAATRFVPGVGAFLGASYLLTALLKGISIGSTQVAGFAMFALCLTAGYIAMLALLRQKLHATVRVTDRRSFLAGFAAVGVLVGLSMLHWSPTPPFTVDALAFLAGAATTLATFFPRLRGPMARFERTENGQLYAAVVELAADRNTPARAKRNINAV